MNISIPRKTRFELTHPASQGMRHSQIVKLSTSLIRSGIQPEAIFTQLRSMYGPDIRDSEIWNVIRWVETKNPKQSLEKNPVRNVSPSESKKSIPPKEMIIQFLRNSNVEDLSFDDLEVELWEVSPWKSDEWKDDSLMLLAGAYYASERINIVHEHSDEGKPKGYGETLSRDEWIRHVQRHGTPFREAGCWIRMNPLDGQGISDSNVAAHRFTLIEFDDIPLHLQLALVSKLKLPVAAIISSGGRSIHSWLRLDAKDSSSYRQIVEKLYATLSPFGICGNNKNPSRMSRFPSVHRSIGSQGDGRQRLLYFNPDSTEWRAIL
jgi:hypothetical protein